MIAPDDHEAVMRAALDACLTTAETWLGWSGQARVGIGSVWTPHKVMRRITDHLIEAIGEYTAEAPVVQT